MKIFDCHCHIENGFQQYNIEVAGRNIIFNTIESYQQHKNELSEADALTLVFDYRNNFELVKKSADEKKIAALKIHSRIQKIQEEDYPVLIERLENLNPVLPIIIDAFYYGDDLEFQPNLKYIIEIAKKFPSCPIVVAHCGGYEVLKYFYHLKSLENIYFDLSFSPAYLKNTSVYADFKNLIKFGNENRLMFGTDFPFINAKEQLNSVLQILEECRIKEGTSNRILFSNAAELFQASRK